MVPAGSYVFVSYVRDDAAEVDRLCQALTAQGIRVWRDVVDIKPGARWKDEIIGAIQDCTFFLACFSQKSIDREVTLQRWELRLAEEWWTVRRPGASWFIPVLLDRCSISELATGDFRWLSEFQAESLCPNWGSGIERLAEVLKSTGKFPAALPLASVPAGTAPAAVPAPPANAEPPATRWRTHAATGILLLAALVGGATAWLDRAADVRPPAAAETSAPSKAAQTVAAGTSRQPDAPKREAAPPSATPRHQTASKVEPPVSGLSAANAAVRPVTENPISSDGDREPPSQPRRSELVTVPPQPMTSIDPPPSNPSSASSAAADLQSVERHLETATRAANAGRYQDAYEAAALARHIAPNEPDVGKVYARVLKEGCEATPRGGREVPQKLPNTICGR